VAILVSQGVVREGVTCKGISFTKRHQRMESGMPRVSAPKRKGRPRAAGNKSRAPSSAGTLGGKVLGVLAASGLLATVTGLVITKGWDQWTDRAADAVGQNAIAVHAEDRTIKVGVGDQYALDKDIEGPLPASPKISAFLMARHAAQVGISSVDVVLENRRREIAVLTSMVAVVRHRRPPLDAVIVVAGDGGGTGYAPVRVAFDLDSVDLAGRVVDGNDQPTATPFLDRAGITLNPGEKLRFHLIGASRSSYVEWSVEVSFLVGGSSRLASVASASDPLRVSAPAAAYASAYRWTEKGLEKIPVRDACDGCNTPTPQTT
jgi:hypothetical protein